MRSAFPHLTPCPYHAPKVPLVRRQALQLLATLATDQRSAAQLCSPTLFSAVLAIARIQAENADFISAERALKIVDSLLVWGGLRPHQRNMAEQLAVALREADDEALVASAEHTQHLCEGLQYHTEWRWQISARLQDTFNSLFPSPGRGRTGFVDGNDRAPVGRNESSESDDVCQARTARRRAARHRLIPTFRSADPKEDGGLDPQSDSE